MPIDVQDIFARAKPSYDGHYRLSGLESQVDIYRDASAAPHIWARSAKDGFFAQGWVHAQDRFWQMEADRLKAYGRWAEVVGPQGLDQDIFWRRLRLKFNAKNDFSAAHSDAKMMLTAYAAGVNAFLHTNPCIPECELLAHRPEPWDPWDSIAVFKSRHINMNRWEHKIWRMNIARQFGPTALELLFPPTPQYRFLVESDPPPFNMDALFTPTFLTEEDEGGSNNWVVSGSRTESGFPILAGDPHRAVDVPNVYYQNHMVCDLFDVAGFSFAGVPGFPHFAHNARVAWSITHAAADTQDIYLEVLSPDHRSYRRRGDWVPVDREEDTIRVRGGDTVSVELLVAGEGPIIQIEGTRALALKAVALQEPNKTWDALWDMLGARNIDDLDTAMENWVEPVNNLLYADQDGNIGYRMRGKLPIRPLANAWVPVDAESGRFSWRGFVPFHQMARIINPPDGFLVTANNQVVDDRYPHYVALDFAAPHRRNRIAELITARSRWTSDAMRSIHADIRSLSALNLVSYMLEAIPETQAGRALQQRLAGWDGSLSPESPLPTLYSWIRRHVVEMFMASATSLEFLRQSAGTPPLTWQAGRLNGHLSLLLQDSTSPVARAITRQNLWARALDAAGREFPDPEAIPLWQSVHILRPTHPLASTIPEAAALLNPRPISIGGDGDTVQAASFGGSGFQITGTSVARYVFDLAEWDRSGWIVPLGVSGVGGSAHYEDQKTSWAHHELQPMHFSASAVTVAAVHHTVLEVG